MMKMSIACSHGWTLCVSAPRSVRRGCFCGTNGCHQEPSAQCTRLCGKAGTGNSAKAACDGTDEPSEPRRLSGPRCRQGSVAAARRAGLRVASSCPSLQQQRWSGEQEVWSEQRSLWLRSFPELRPAVQNVLGEIGGRDVHFQVRTLVQTNRAEGNMISLIFFFCFFFLELENRKAAREHPSSRTRPHAKAHRGPRSTHATPRATRQSGGRRRHAGP